MPKRLHEQDKKYHKLLIMPVTDSGKFRVSKRRRNKRQDKWRGTKALTHRLIEKKKKRNHVRTELGKRKAEFIDLLSDNSLCEEVDVKSFNKNGLGQIKSEENQKQSNLDDNIVTRNLRAIYNAKFYPDREQKIVYGEEKLNFDIFYNQIEKLEVKEEDNDDDLIKKRRSVFTSKRLKKKKEIKLFIQSSKISKVEIPQAKFEKQKKEFLEKLIKSSDNSISEASNNLLNLSLSKIQSISETTQNKMEKITGPIKGQILSESYYKPISEETLTKVESCSPKPKPIESTEENSNQSQNIQDLLSNMTPLTSEVTPTKLESFEPFSNQRRSLIQITRGDPSHKFYRLKILMEKFFLNQKIQEDDLILDTQSKLLFRKIIEKKNHYLPFGTAWKAESVMSLSRSTSQKRNEEKLKYVFKLTLKNMKRQYRPKHFHFCGEELQGEYQKSASEDKELGFYCYHFREYLKGGSKENNLSQFPAKFIKGGRLNVEEIIQSCSSGHKHQEKNSQKKFLRSIEVINKDFVQALSLSQSFMQEFQRFLQITDNSEKEEKGIEILGDVIDIYKESTKLIRRKVELKIKQWLKTWTNCDNNNARFENFINAEFSRKKYKLPWTLTDVRSAVHTVSAFLKTGFIVRN